MDKVGPYELERLIATGGQAQVWLAKGPKGAVALKVARTDGHRAGILREVKVQRMRGAAHPNLVAMIDAADDGAWMALEHVEGDLLDQWSVGEPIEAIVRIATQIVDVLAHLHKLGVVHGDIKPTNVIVDSEGRARLFDLGVASTSGERIDGFRGTLGYAAPELLRNDPPSPLTDVYGLGALIYTCICGRTPFVAPDPAALTYLPLVSLPPPPAAFVPDIPGALNTLLLALLTRDARRRPGDLVKVREALEKAVESLPPPPVLGMLEEREELRRAVVGAADGEPRVVVIYGPPGSGRRTLIAETVEYARREGLPYLKGTDPQAALKSLRETSRPCVLVMRASSMPARQLAQLVLKEGLKCLFLMHSERPVPPLVQDGAIHVTPSPLQIRDVTRLARIWGGDVELATRWWKETFGLPTAVLGRIRAWRRDRGMTLTKHDQLPAESKRIHDTIRAKPGMKAGVIELAKELEMEEHMLLDHCEVLFAEEIIEPVDGGLSVGIIRARPVK